MSAKLKHERPQRERGAVAVLVAVLIVVLVGMAALALDLSHLFVVDNELQNAADAGALAGALNLYNSNGTAILESANQVAYVTATSNRSENVAVEVNWSGGNSGDVERGHWSFGSGSFTPSASLTPFDLWDHTTEQLDGDANFINAVRVRARRQATPAASFFARIFGFQSFQKEAEAVAYIGFAGQLEPHEVDEPIAICKEYILQSGAYTCSVGRMINSGNNTDHETGAWTSFNQIDPCLGGTNANELRPLICAAGNPGTILLGAPVATIGGEVNVDFKSFFDCWVANSANRTMPWQLTLPVIECGGSNPGPCNEVVGAVTVNIVWVCEKTDPHFSDFTPTQMGDWRPPSTVDMGTEAGRRAAWLDFCNYFNLRDVDRPLDETDYQQKTIYFLPDCTPHDLKGHTGGENFGVLAKYPVLVH